MFIYLLFVYLFIYLAEWHLIIKPNVNLISRNGAASQTSRNPKQHQTLTFLSVYELYSSSLFYTLVTSFYHKIPDRLFSSEQREYKGGNILRIEQGCVGCEP